MVSQSFLYFQVQLHLPTMYQNKYKWHIIEIDSGTQNQKGGLVISPPHSLLSSKHSSVQREARCWSVLFGLNPGEWGYDFLKCVYTAGKLGYLSCSRIWSAVCEWHGSSGWKGPTQSLAGGMAYPLSAMLLSSRSALCSQPKEVGRFLHRPHIVDLCGSAPSQADLWMCWMPVY